LIRNRDRPCLLMASNLKATCLVIPLSGRDGHEERFYVVERDVKPDDDGPLRIGSVARDRCEESFEAFCLA